MWQLKNQLLPIGLIVEYTGIPGGVLPIKVYTGRLTRKEHLLQARDI